MKLVRRAGAGALLVAMAPVQHAAGQAWQQYATAEEAGFSSAALERIRARGDSLRSAAVFVVYRGKVLAAWGDVARKLELHSMRKSITSALYGISVADGRIDLRTTLAELGIDDTTRLTSTERAATVGDLIAARSGVYLPAAYAGSDQDSTRPARGRHAPGTNWFYNNWDFNVAETIYRMRAGRTVYDAFGERIAAPLGMEDFSVSDGFLVFEPSRSRYPAHTWRMSARDLARFGQMFVQRGEWNGRQVVPASWVDESTSPHSDLGNGRGYGYMWWTYAKDSFGERYGVLNQYAAYAASGTGGHAIVVVPGAELVVVHRSDTDHNRNVPGGAVWALVQALLDARTGSASANPRLMPVEPVPFTSQLPPLAMPVPQPVSAAELASLVGEYDFGQPAPVRISAFEGRPFVFLPGEGEAEMIRVADGRYTIRVVQGVTIDVERDASTRVERLTLRMGPRTIVANRK